MSRQYKATENQILRISNMVCRLEQVLVFNVYHSGVMAGFLHTALTVAQG